MSTIVILNFLIFQFIFSFAEILGESSKYIINDVLSNFRSDDLSELRSKLVRDPRIIDLVNGEHFDDILRDTPDGMRPPSIILFWNSSDSQCSKDYHNLNFKSYVYSNLPSRGFLLTTTYDMYSAPKRAWYKFVPERDLAKRFNVNSRDPQDCPSLVWIPENCDGFTDWCVAKNEDGVQYLGCENFGENCKNFEKYTGSLKNSDNGWVNWVSRKIVNSPKPSIGGPNPDTKFGNLQEQENWILRRDRVTTETQLRNMYASASLPAFSEKGYKAVEMPKGLMQDFFDFYNHYKDQRSNENWESYGQTQVNGHEVSPYLIYMDLNQEFRDEVANRYIKPLLEEWVGFPLRLTSHYGLREYHSGSWLRNHIDRIDVLVISVTMSIMHIKKSEENDFITFENYDTWDKNITWPLEAVDWNGNNVRYQHKPGTLLMYESAKLPHGRPYPMPYGKNGEELLAIASFCHFAPLDDSWANNGHSVNAQHNVQRNSQENYGSTSYTPPKYEL